MIIIFTVVLIELRVLIDNIAITQLDWLTEQFFNWVPKLKLSL